MNLKGFKRYYIFCEANGTSGGHELLHQLVHKLIYYGKDVKIIYYPISKENEVPIKFKNYVNSIYVAFEAEDASDICIIVSESLTILLRKFKKATAVIWWLSIDNYFFSNGKNDLISQFLKLSNHIKFIYKYKSNRASFYRMRDKINLVQSYYAYYFLKCKKFRHVYNLSDYVNINESSLINVSGVRKEVILYNPKKGSRITKSLIKYSRRYFPDLEFVPLINMTRSQLVEIMQSSMVYMDFGNHPGKDRIPREAALNGLVIIVGKRGSANNSIDIPIPDMYKLEYNKHIKSNFLELLLKVLSNYETLKHDFTTYITQIISEKKIFEDQVYELFVD